MKIDKPDELSLSAQPLDLGGRLHQCLTVGLGLDVLSGKATAADVALAAAMKALAPGDCLDMGVPKKEAEWLLAGKACAPGASPVSQMTVDIRVGKSARRFLVTNNAPFAAMPLVWDKTWGSPEENPGGLAPAQLRRAPLSDEKLPFGVPACPGPRGVWPCRMKKMGTYDRDWLKTRWPGLPDDFDWTFFNLAQPSQRLPQGIHGGDPVELVNLHPDHPRLALNLPDRKVRLFIARNGEWKENPIIPDTLWLFPNQLAGLILWHAMPPCVDESASDIEALRLELDPAAAPEAAAAASIAAAAGISVAGAAAGAGGKSGPTTAATARTAETATTADSAQDAGSSVPSSQTTPSSQQATANMKTELSSQFDESLDEINAALTEAGLGPMTEAQIAETRERLNTMAEYMQQIEAAAGEPLPDFETQLRQAGVSEARIAAVQAAMNLEMPDPAAYGDAASWQAAVDAHVASFAAIMQPSDAVTNNMRTLMRLQGPGGEALLEEMAGGPPPTVEAQLVQAGMDPAAASRLLEMLDGDMPSDLNGLSEYARGIERAAGFPEGSVSGRIDAVRDVLRKAGIEEAPPEQATPPASEFAMAEAGAAGTADGVSAQEASEATEATAKESLSGEAASGGTPSDRSGVLLLLAGGGSLAGLALAGIDLSGLDLSGQNMGQTSLRGANLAASRLDGASLVGADLSGADLSGTSFADADLSGAKLAGAKAPQGSFVRSRLDGADLSALAAPDADFTGASLAGASLAGALLAGATFNESRADGLNAVDADLSGARLRFCEMRDAAFDKANLAGADFHQATLDAARFRAANLEGTTFCSGTSVSGGDFVGASLRGGVWTQVHAPGAVFTGGSAAGAMFTDCDFSAASWRGADLRNGDFSRSRLQGADMQGVNLFRGSLREAGLERADLRGANLYGVDMCRAATDAGTNLAGADFTNTILTARKEA